MKKKFGLVVVNYNNQKSTLSLLRSVENLHKSSFETKWVVVDNGSIGNIVPQISQKFPEVEILQNGENLGLLGGFNRGMRYLFAWGANYVMAINNKTILENKSLISESVQLLAQNEKLATRDYYLVSRKNLLSEKGYFVNNNAQRKKQPQGVSWPIKLSVAIVHYKTPALTQKLLQSLLQENKNIEIVVLNNGSGNNFNQLLKEKFPSVKLIDWPENSGFSKGYNLAMDYCRGQYLLMLNSDIEVRKGSIKKLIEVADKHNGKIILTGKLVLPDGLTQPSAFHLPTALGAIKEFFLGKKGAFFEYLPDQNKPTRVEGAVMACFLLPQIIRNRVGRLDERTSLYFEDVEYCRRLQKIQVPIKYVSEAVFNHHHGASSKKLPEGEAYRKLKKASLRYHGWLNYWFITSILWIGQKFIHLNDKKN
ncbi:MAG: glycosyltransferase [Candidatus Shapirobacteria bacterium]|nr:glycosyltransferase [Candidatus Shapirobacteria bacterium]